MKGKKVSYKVDSNFASDFFCLRDLKRLEPLLENWEYMMEYRSVMYCYSFYFNHWNYNSKK